MSSNFRPPWSKRLLSSKTSSRLIPGPARSGPVWPGPAHGFQGVIFAIVVVPESQVLDLVADAELDPVAVGKFQDECEGVRVLASVDVVHKGAVDVNETGPRVKGGAKPYPLLKADVPDPDGAGETTLLQRAGLQANRVLEQARPEDPAVGCWLMEVQQEAGLRASLQVQLKLVPTPTTASGPFLLNLGEDVDGSEGQALGVCKGHFLLGSSPAQTVGWDSDAGPQRPERQLLLIGADLWGAAQTEAQSHVHGHHWTRHR